MNTQSRSQGKPGGRQEFASTIEKFAGQFFKQLGTSEFPANAGLS